jgi:UDP-glucose 4-epimerase
MTADSVLITGSSGFIGTALAERLLEAGHDVTGVDREPNPWSTRVDDRTERLDLLADDLSDVAGAHDVIVHLAAHSRVGSSVENPSEATENARTTRRVLEFARTTDVGHVLFASSREVYGLDDAVVFEEADATPRDCANPYAASKLFGESLCWAYANCYGLETTALRFTNVYGRYDDQSRVVPLFVAQALAGDRLTVYGDAKLLDFVYVDDCVDAIERAIERREQAAGEAVNVGSGVGTSLVELAREVADAIDQCPGYDVTSEQTGEPTKMVADLGRARALLGYEPAYDFGEGLAETIAWYRERPDVTGALR